MKRGVRGAWGGACIFGALLGFAGFVTGSAHAADTAPEAKASGGSRNVQAFGDWNRLCETPEKSTTRVCFAFQKVDYAETKAQLLQAVVGYFRKDVPDPMLIVTVPLGVVLGPGLEIRVPGKAPLKDGYDVCLSRGCQAVMRVDAEKMKVLTSGAEAEVVFFDAKRQQISVPLSLKGLNDAVNDLKKQRL